MKKLKIIITISILFILVLYLTIELYSFIETKKWNILIKKNADNIAKNIEANELSIFKEWSCGTRGEMELWNKNDTINIRYYHKIDSTVIYLKKIESFLNSDLIKSDTSINNYILTKKRQEKSYLYGYNKNLYEVIKDSFTNNIFQNKLNLFDLVHKFSAIKLKYKIPGSAYQAKSKIIRIYISNQHVLYYIPDSNNTEQLNLNKLIPINKVWYFEKLDVPLDNG